MAYHNKLKVFYEDAAVKDGQLEIVRQILEKRDVADLVIEEHDLNTDSGMAEAMKFGGASDPLTLVVVRDRDEAVMIHLFDVMSDGMVDMHLSPFLN